jgi:hypothetical protein
MREDFVKLRCDNPQMVDDDDCNAKIGGQMP